MTKKHWTDEFFNENWLKYGFLTREGEDAEQTVTIVEWVLGGACYVLDLACGVGRVAIPLADRGYNVVGTDFQPDYVGEATRRSGRVKSAFRGWRYAEPGVRWRVRSRYLCLDELRLL